jgi:hypothetical protein
MHRGDRRPFQPLHAASGKKWRKVAAEGFWGISLGPADRDSRKSDCRSLRHATMTSGDMAASALDSPLVIPFEQDCADPPIDGVLAEQDADELRAPAWPRR